MCCLDFEKLSGLFPSPGKSDVYFSGVDQIAKQDILRILDFKKGCATCFRYVGVPLITNKMRCNDCKPLIDRVSLLCWKGTTYQIDLFSMQVYWLSLFVLPKKVIKLRASEGHESISVPKPLRGIGSKIYRDVEQCSDLYTYLVSIYRRRTIFVVPLG